MSKANGKLKTALGTNKGEAPMRTVAKLSESDVRPGGWKTFLLPAESESDVHKSREVPVLIDDKIVGDVADGKKSSDIEDELELPRGYVRRVLIRRFGSVEGMKRACQAQCLENAIALNEYAMERITQIPAGQALVGAKIMIDGALALEKNRVDKPTTVDFAALAALGGVLERVEKIVTGTDRTIAPA